MPDFERLLGGRVLTWTRDIPLLEKGPASDAFRGYALKADNGEVVLIDPPDPGSDVGEIDRFGKPKHILVTFRDHDRAVGALAERYGAKVWIPRGKGGAVPRADVEYDEQTVLPAGLNALSMPSVGYGEHALYGTALGKRFVFIGDAIMNMDYERMPWIVRFLLLARKRGQLQHKKSYRGGNTRKALQEIRKLLEVEPDALFFSHGRPIESGAAPILRESVESWT